MKNKFIDVYDKFLIFEERKLKSQTFKNQCYNFNKNILSYFKDYYIEDIGEIEVIEWEKYIEKQGFSNNHSKHLFCYLKKFLSYCKKHYNYNDDFMVEIGQIKPKIEKNKSDHYTIKEFKKFIKYVDNNIYKQFFNFIFFVGTRPGETMALKFSDLNKGIISINKTIDGHGKREIGTPKTTSSYRELLIDKKLNKDLLKLKRYYQEKYQDDTYDYFIFGGKKPLSSTTINRYKIKACKMANIRPITLHQYRHSHATLLMNKGVIFHEISKRLGHSSVNTTINVYTHSNLEQEKRVYQTLNSCRYNFFIFQLLRLKNFISNLLKH